MMYQTAALVCLAALVLSAGGEAPEGQEPDVLLVDDFEAEPTEEGLPPEWEKLEFEDIPEHTRYELRQEEGNQFLHASARDSASGLVKKIAFKPSERPVLKWRWRIGGVLEQGDATRKSGDDYAARIYINFKYDPDKVGTWTRIQYALAKRRLGEYPPLHSLNYIWANRIEQGTFIENAYTGRAMMVAVQSGEDKAGEWVSEERNIVEDYREAFGEEPTDVIAVAVMTDADNTGESARADYDDILFEAVPEEE
ncbi:MAG: DUF3047 domain-containing protein [Candidatus Brocadiia bacterium]